MRKKIGECLIQAGLITEENLQTALTEHRRTGERLGAVLVRMELATEKQVTKALAWQLGFPYVSLADDPPDRSVITLIPREVAEERGCVALKLEKNQLTVAMADPLLFSLVQDLEFQTGFRIKQVVATKSDILQAIDSGYPDRALQRVGGREGIALQTPPWRGRQPREAESSSAPLARRREEPDDVFEFGGELRIVADLEGFD